ncbi:NAD binding domain of 6-phosphogluconate dehydrogenase-domain-containing protein [Papiliotrema laurentii]|uniref:3-hydroxyisobutyrate dehydrogenase n=1 Tax=Papiliotrema laurentii TaxID=5418 RepID=A0AAD9FNP3_PAPLA|nr:NAD binding domain of 6-phosphogluconate dehydrogenase-domain-containing protein [Papiliotrema laurentii]
MTASVQNIGFIGLGAMGYRMAANLRSKLPYDSVLTIYDVASAVLDQFAEEHDGFGKIHLAKNSSEVVERSDVVITIVPEGSHVRSIMSSEPGGALSVEVKGKLFLECSTIDMATSHFVSKTILGLGGDFVDAPVSGGPAGAEKGTLTFMMGLKEDHPRVSEIRSILSLMGNNLFACGGPTLGLATKICNNYISGTIAIATSEGMNLAMNLGLNPKVFSDVLKVSTGGSWVNAHCNPVPGVDPDAPASKDYAPGFKVQFMLKDYKLALEAAASSNSKLYLGPAGLDVYSGATEDPNCVDRDSRVVFRYIGGREKW